MYVILGEVFQVFPIISNPCPPGDDIEIKVWNKKEKLNTLGTCFKSKIDLK